MINVSTVAVGMIAANCYIVWGDGRNDCVLIDPGAEPQKIESKLKQLGLAPKAILLTHSHFDHIGAAAYFRKQNVEIYIHNSELELLPYNNAMARHMGDRYEDFMPDHFVIDGQILDLCGMQFEVIFTPGHSAGGVCYKCEDKIFSGDTLFYLSIGRTDFPTGSYSDMRASLGKLFAIAGDCRVFPGHGRPTTLDFEKNNNPYA